MTEKQKKAAEAYERNKEKKKLLGEEHLTTEDRKERRRAYQRAYAKQWREAHPEYFKKYRTKRKEEAKEQRERENQIAKKERIRSHLPRGVREAVEALERMRAEKEKP